MDAGNQQRQVVGLGAGTEMMHVGQDSTDNLVHREVAVGAQGFEEPRLAEFFFVCTRLGHPVAEHGQKISGRQLHPAHGTLPFLEQAEYRRGRPQMFDGSALLQPDRRVMTAIRVNQLTRRVVINSKEEGGVVFRVRGSPQHVVHVLQKPHWVERHAGALAAKVCL